MSEPKSLQEAILYFSESRQLPQIYCGASLA